MSFTASEIEDIRVQFDQVGSFSFYQQLAAIVAAAVRR